MENLKEFDFEEGLRLFLGGKLPNGKGAILITMSEGQWDNFLDVGYKKNEAILVLINDLGEPIKFYKKENGNKT